VEDFIVEPFVKHEASDEYYVAIRSIREGDEVLFYHAGGIDVGDVDSKAQVYFPFCTKQHSVLIANCFP